MHMEEKNNHLSDEEVVKRAKAAVRIELEKNREKGIPSAVYDRKTGKIYQINSDGTRVEVGKRILKGSYSERKKA